MLTAAQVPAKSLSALALDRPRVGHDDFAMQDRNVIANARPGLGVVVKCPTRPCTFALASATVGDTRTFTITESVDFGKAARNRNLRGARRPIAFLGWRADVDSSQPTDM